MALTELRSDLSWYGKNPGPYKTPANREATKFKGEDNIPYVSTGGYEFQGIALVSPVQRFAGNSFLIDTGTSSRGAQLGAGTRFPIGPEGQVHEFDIARTGFSNKAPYSRNYGIQHKNSGLANTYTLNSPIDDMYNKFNLRDDATPNSYIKHPLILRGIQRNGSSDPQRWGIDVGPGLSGAFDIPRGGILTAANRTLIDVARHAKFLASPRGIGFLAKQVGYQLMNPKAETRIYNPLSLGSLAPILHINRQFSADGILGGLVSKLAGGTADYGTRDTSTLHEDLRNEFFPPPYYDHPVHVGGEISTLSSNIGGPGSILGIGGTSIKRWEDTSLDGQLWWRDKTIEVTDYKLRQFNYEHPYQKTRGQAGGSYTIQDIDGGWNLRNVEPDSSILHYHLRGLVENGFNFVNGTGGGKAEQKEGSIINDYKRMAYGDIPSRIPSTTPKNIDFRDIGSKDKSQVSKIWKDATTIDTLDAHLDNSLVKFKFGDIAFKAYIGSLNDVFAPSWNGQADQGRADARYLYTGFERTLSLDFLVPIMSKTDRGAIWEKLQSLARLTYPTYGTNGFYGSAINVTIGDLFKSKSMIITDLGYAWDPEYPWDIETDRQAPMYTDVTMTFTVLGSKPDSSTDVYASTLTTVEPTS